MVLILYGKGPYSEMIDAERDWFDVFIKFKSKKKSGFQKKFNSKYYLFMKLQMNQIYIITQFKNKKVI